MISSSEGKEKLTKKFFHWQKDREKEWVHPLCRFFRSKKITQAELARWCEVNTQAQISQWFRGYIRMPEHIEARLIQLKELIEAEEKKAKQ